MGVHSCRLQYGCYYYHLPPVWWTAPAPRPASCIPSPHQHQYLPRVYRIAASTKTCPAYVKSSPTPRPASRAVNRLQHQDLPLWTQAASCPAARGKWPRPRRAFSRPRRHCWKSQSAACRAARSSPSGQRGHPAPCCKGCRQGKEVYDRALLVHVVAQHLAAKGSSMACRFTGLKSWHAARSAPTRLLNTLLLGWRKRLSSVHKNERSFTGLGYVACLTSSTTAPFGSHAYHPTSRHRAPSFHHFLWAQCWI